MWWTNTPMISSLIPKVDASKNQLDTEADTRALTYILWPWWTITIEWEHSVFTINSEFGKFMRAISDWTTVIDGKSYTKYSYSDTDKEFVCYVLTSKVSELISQYQNKIYYSIEENNHRG